MLPEELEVERWMQKADHDISVVDRILYDGGPELDIAAFHCQQAVEKLLKAYLVQIRTPFEKIHDLGVLLNHCVMMILHSKCCAMRSNR